LWCYNPSGDGGDFWSGVKCLGLAYWLEIKDADFLPANIKAKQTTCLQCLTALQRIPKNFKFVFKSMFGNLAAAAFPKNLNFFLLKFNMVCMFWIVLMC
jgi:hypothetical protein